MATVALRSPSEKVGGLFYFGRMLDKIRLHAKGQLPSDYHANLGKGFDEKCVRFLRVNYDQLVERVKKGGTDEEILRWCFDVGRRPNEDDIYVWNEFMRKRGWNDEVSEILKVRSICFFSSSHSGIFFIRSFRSAALIRSAITAQRVSPENRFAMPNRARLL